MGSPASNPYAPTPRACWIPAANTGVLKTVSTTFATSPLMKIARASAVAQAPRSWPPFAISPYRFSASPELATSPQHFAAVLVRAIPSSFASSGCDFDVAVQPGSADQLNDGQRSSKHSNPEEENPSTSTASGRVTIMSESIAAMSPSPHQDKLLKIPIKNDRIFGYNGKRTLRLE